jgi:hypothetical protein
MNINHTNTCRYYVPKTRLKYFKTITLTLTRIIISTNKEDRQDPRVLFHEQPSMLVVPVQLLLVVCLYKKRSCNVKKHVYIYIKAVAKVLKLRNKLGWWWKFTPLQHSLYNLTKFVQIYQVTGYILRTNLRTLQSVWKSLQHFIELFSVLESINTLTQKKTKKKWKPTCNAFCFKSTMIFSWGLNQEFHLFTNYRLIHT